MLTAISVAALFLVAIVAWVRTHMDLLSCAWFRRHKTFRLVAMLGGPVLGLVGAAVLSLIVADSRAWALIGVASSIAAVGIVLLIVRPYRPKLRVRTHALHDRTQ